jgi:hypothetical protein
VADQSRIFTMSSPFDGFRALVLAASFGEFFAIGKRLTFTQ